MWLGGEIRRCDRKEQIEFVFNYISNKGLWNSQDVRYQVYSDYPNGLNINSVPVTSQRFLGMVKYYLRNI